MVSRGSLAQIVDPRGRMETVSIVDHALSISLRQTQQGSRHGSQVNLCRTKQDLCVAVPQEHLMIRRGLIFRSKRQ